MRMEESLGLKLVFFFIYKNKVSSSYFEICDKACDEVLEDHIDYDLIHVDTKFYAICTHLIHTMFIFFLS